MRTTFIVCRIGAVFAVLLFCGRSFAQGCGLGIVIELIPCYIDKNGNVTDTEDQTCQAGGAGASPCFECYEGSGYCTDTELPFTTANLAENESCPGCVPPPPTCCNGGITCGYRQVCANSLGGGAAASTHPRSLLIRREKGSV
jgi:hypothetical protein